MSWKEKKRKSNAIICECDGTQTCGFWIKNAIKLEIYNSYFSLKN